MMKSNVAKPNLDNVEKTVSGTIAYVEHQSLNRAVRRDINGINKRGEKLIHPGVGLNVSASSLNNEEFKKIHTIESARDESLGSIPSSVAFQGSGKFAKMVSRKGGDNNEG